MENHKAQKRSRSPDGPVEQSHAPAAIYEKRARHKTKVDKYDRKDDTKAKERHRKDKRHSSRRNRQRRPGLTVGHDFKAANVLQERLTVSSIAWNTGEPYSDRAG